MGRYKVGMRGWGKNLDKEHPGSQSQPHTKPGETNKTATIRCALFLIFNALDASDATLWGRHKGQKDDRNREEARQRWQGPKVGVEGSVRAYRMCAVKPWVLCDPTEHLYSAKSMVKRRCPCQVEVRVRNKVLSPQRVCVCGVLCFAVLL